MCGILGELNLGEQIDVTAFDECRDAMTHRGPDGFGTEVLNDGRVALGHRRLAIIDLTDDGKQPMCNEDSTVWITFNGEIYNFRKLREELINCGHTFRSHSDTEVLVHGYEQWGIKELLNRINGMFAFAIWDDQSKTLYCARDRFGIKPLYYTHQASHFGFSSEIKGLENQGFTLNKGVISDYFTYGYIPGPATIWNEVHKLDPGYYIEVDSNLKLSKKRYYRLRTGNAIIDEREAVSLFETQFNKSVLSHLESDVPVGIFLSGGYDSTAISTAVLESNRPLASYSIGFEGWNRSEHMDARAISKELGTTHYERVLTDANLGHISQLAYYYDEPYCTTGELPYYQVSNLASKHCKVVLAGDGGDEVLGGYKWHAKLLSEHQNSSPIKRIIHSLFSKLYFSYLVKSYDQKVSYMPPSSNFTLNQFLSKEYQDANYRTTWVYEKANLNKDSLVKNFQLIDFDTFLLEACLTRADRSSMANSLEVRVPFLDHNLVELVLSFNEKVYFKPEVKKFLLNEYLKSRINNQFLELPKRGFSNPLLRIFENKRFKNDVLSGVVRGLGILNPNYFSNMEKFGAKAYWSVVVLEYWLRRWYN
ncbi:asparagine synthase (glutamine-hydrolyzing) [Marinoscillum furvescens]|uniref:asparagine synthase (glutamine-hydrolyzing) n=1 Tax=Marinoscillum furvescens DSM 4134 TaxID=1122208 RepID=A0A3D9L368_MARFU|nr:asparagine synthase (glutamine-hydrolyzing) [Marinoscillum furvescens]RED99546.1 asparagine synthase (glutamine-hydrolysing) [Marinoscillum furvescens DSM 4134]